MTKDWHKHRSTILDIYKIQGKTLEDTMRIMQEEHGFRASVRAYRSRFKKWDCNKYNKPSRHGEQGVFMAPTAMAGSSPAKESVAMNRQALPHPAVVRPLMTRPPRAESSTLQHSRARRSGPGYHSTITPALQFKAEPYTDSGSSVGSMSPSDYGSQQQYYSAASFDQYQTSYDRIQGLAPEPHNDEAFRTRGQSRHLSLQGLLPNTHRQAPYLQLPAGSDGLTAIRALSGELFAPTSPSASPVEAEQYMQRLGAHRLNEAFSDACGNVVSAFELHIQALVARRPALSRDDIVLSTLFVRYDADATRIVPPGFEHTVAVASRSNNQADVVQNAVLSHRQQDGAGYAIPAWASVWVSACQQSLRGNTHAVDQHLEVLPYLNGQLNVPVLWTFLPQQVSPVPFPLTPDSLVNHPGNIPWDQAPM